MKTHKNSEKVRLSERGGASNWQQTNESIPESKINCK